MKIAVIGAGMAGKVLSAYLRMGGAEVYIVDKNKSVLENIKDNGIKIQSGRKEYRTDGFVTADTASQIGIMDIVIIMVKSIYTESVIYSAKPCIGSATVVATFQNGLGNDDIISGYTERDMIIAGNALLKLSEKDDGTVIAEPIDKIGLRFGEIESSIYTKDACKYLKKIFKKGGLDVEYFEDIRPYIWEKAIFYSGIGPISALLRLKPGILGTDENAKWLVEHAWKEGCEVAKTQGIEDLWPRLQKRFDNLTGSMADYYPPFASDVLIKKIQTEVSCLNSVIAGYGKKYAIATPVNEIVSKMILSIQANYKNQF